jgi:murein L,D-transpeptidase YcbB/YkuD
MKRNAIAICGVLLAAPLAAQEPAALPGWSPIHVASLKHSIVVAAQEGLPALSSAQLDREVAAGNQAGVDEAATRLALQLGRLHLLGATPNAQRKAWHIVDTDNPATLRSDLADAIAAGGIERFFASLRPASTDYALLASAYATETDTARRATLALNLDRWRWMPRSLGDDYVLVNPVQFEASRWQKGERVGTWRVITGKTSSPTPVFNATITGVTLNPWWEVPANIVRESVGALVRRNPKLARARGYVWGGGRYRQKPGPNNSLGQMKLVMPNPYSVYMHDTPSKGLFEKDVRAFSHGCVRVGNALDFAASLLAPATPREKVDEIVASGKTTTVPLPHSVPVYIAYFTTASDASGALVFKPDIYGRDGAMPKAAKSDETCAA